jgi:hypothetical protein
MQAKLVPNKTYVELYVWLEASIEPEFSFLWFRNTNTWFLGKTNFYFTFFLKPWPDSDSARAWIRIRIQQIPVTESGFRESSSETLL